MLRRLRHALLTLAVTLGLVGLAATPAHAVCNDLPNECTRIVHSVYSDVANLSVSRVYPAQSGYIEALARGTAGTYAGVYVPVCYQAKVTDQYYGTYIWVRGWHSVGVLMGSTVVDLQKIC